MTRWPWLGLWGALALSACLDPNPMFAEPTDSAADSEGGAPRCGDGVIDPGETCDEGAYNGADQPCTPECQNNRCGDGYPGPDEGCDLGEDNGEGSACTYKCETNRCGDGVLGPGEECDEGEDNDDDGACLPSCLPASCGDGLVGPGEDCDDGPANAEGASCGPDCALNICGDGVIGPGEGCDDGNLMGGDLCSPTCAPVGCGDGVLGPGEVCDEGKENSDAGLCTSKCVPAACGDGSQQRGNYEKCDDGNKNPNDACTDGCALAVCGDKIVYYAEEQCDDGNVEELDQCNSKCRKTPAGLLVEPAGVTPTLGDGQAGAVALCLPGDVMVGVTGTFAADGSVSSIAPICAIMTVAPGLNKFQIAQLGAQPTPQIGMVTDKSWVMQCDGSSAVAGFAGAYDGAFHQLSTMCVELDVASENDGSYQLVFDMPTLGQPIGAPGGEPVGPSACPPGQVSIGLAAHVDAAVHSLAFGCGLPKLHFK